MSIEPTQRAARVGMVLEVRYRNAGQFLVSYCTNLSRGGLFVSTPNPQPVGTTITLSLQVPGRAAPVDINAEVRWRRTEDSDEGPAGMGLSFADIDGMLGEHIDRLVSHASPLHIDVVGPSDRASTHLHALVRSLVTCETRQLPLGPNVEPTIERPDLVVVDVDGNSRHALPLLEALARRPDKPPVLALCAEGDEELRARVAKLAVVVSTPVDKLDLQQKVLEALGRVQSIRAVPGS